MGIAANEGSSVLTALSRKLERVGRIIGIAGGMGLIAYMDWLVTERLSLGFLYIFPLVLAGITIRDRGRLLLCVAVAVVLRGLFGPLTQSGRTRRGRNCWRTVPGWPRQPSQRIDSAVVHGWCY
jgi:hypothetical protein